MSDAFTHRPGSRWTLDEIGADTRVVVGLLAAEDPSKADRMPTNEEFVAAGAAGLVTAIQRNGGRRHWANVLGLREHGMGRRALYPLAETERQLRSFHDGYSHFRPQREFKEEGRATLYWAAIRHMPVEEWCARIGVAPPRKGRPRSVSAAAG